MKYLITCAAAGLISSCAQNENVDTQGNEIIHSSPNVKPLYEKENAELRRMETSEGFWNWFIDELVMGSDPDDDDFYSGYDRSGRRDDSTKRKRQFVSKNGDTLRTKLESKKQ